MPWPQNCQTKAKGRVAAEKNNARGAQSGAGEGNRTLVSSMGGLRSTIELHPHGAHKKKNIPKNR